MIRNCASTAGCAAQYVPWCIQSGCKDSPIDESKSMYGMRNLPAQLPDKSNKSDSGVGCASAMMLAAVKGQKEVTCGCEGSCSK